MKYSLFVFYLFYTNIVFSQSKNIRFDKLDIENGLSNNYITSIHHDMFGFLWISTIDGLNRYDGYSIKIYKNEPGDTTTIDNNLVRTILEDSHGNIYAITDDCVINKFNYQLDKFERFDITRMDKEIGDVSGLFSCSMDDNDQLWLGTKKGIVQFDTRTMEIKLLPLDTSFNFNLINNILNDRQNNLWFSIDENNNGIYQLLPGNKKPILHYNKKVQDTEVQLDNCRQIFQDNVNGNILVNFGNPGNKVFDLTSNEFIIINTNSISNIAQDYSGDFWYTSANCIFHKSRDNINNLHFEQKSPPLPNELGRIYLDRSGCLWVGTETTGLYKIDISSKKFFCYQTFQQNNQTFSNINVNGINLDKEGILWIGTTKNGIISLSPDYLDKYAILLPTDDNPGLLSGSDFASVISDNKDQIWIGATDGAVSRYNKKTKKFTRYRPDTEPALPEWSIRSLFEDSRGFVWISFLGGISKYEPLSNSFEHYFYLNDSGTLNFPSDFVSCTREDKEGNLWFASSNTYKGLIFLENGTDKFLKMALNDSLPDLHYSCKTLFIDEDIIWIGTEQKGLIKFDRIEHKILKIYTDKDGLPNNNICGILKDDHGNLWISTFRGLSKFNIEKKSFRNFNADDNLQSNQFTYNSCFKLPDGRMVFGGINGFNIFHPDEIVDNPHLPKTVLTGFKISNKPVFQGTIVNKKVILAKTIEHTKKLTLSYKESDISFEFTGLHFASPLKNQYAYHLEGYDKNWVYTDAQKRYVTYTNLPPGEYTFRVKSSNNDRLWCKQEDEVALGITITPPFWKTWWFRVLVVFFLINSVYIWHSLRIRYLRLRRLVLEKKIKERTAEISRKNKELSAQKEELAIQADNLQEANILLEDHSRELKAFSEKLMAQGEDLCQANKELVKLNATKDRFFSIIAHDLRNPFQAIIGLSDMLLDRFSELTEEKKKEWLANVNNSSKNAYVLLENLLEWSRSQTDTITFNPTSIEISPIVQKIKELLSLQASRKNIKIFTNIPEQTKAFADAFMTEIVIRNILSNAIKFTSPGGIINVYAKIEDVYMVLSIADNGIGISKTIINKLFRIDITHVSKGTVGEYGTGLGLILCKEFASKNGGYIKVESEPGKGSTFSLWLPTKADIGHDKEQIEVNKFEKKGKELYPTSSTELLIDPEEKKYHILIVEDNPNILENLTGNLEKRFRVSKATDGKKAFELVLTEMPDLIISDVMMPEMDGFELCEQIKQDERTDHIPIILLTARVSDNSRIQGLQLGADDYVLKPFSINVLTVRINNLLKNRELLRERYSKITINMINDKIEVNAATDSNEAFIYKLTKVVEQNMSDPDFSVDQLSEKVRMNRSTLYRKLMAIANQNPSDLVRSIRLHKAAQLLKNGNIKVSEAMYSVGITNSSHFHKSFKKMFGLSPSEYKKNNELPY